MKEVQMIPYVSPPQTTTTIIHFKDTLSDEDHFQFNLIYESLLIEGLKYLIISSEAFQKKKEN